MSLNIITIKSIVLSSFIFFLSNCELTKTNIHKVKHSKVGIFDKKLNIKYKSNKFGIINSIFFNLRAQINSKLITVNLYKKKKQELIPIFNTYYDKFSKCIIEYSVSTTKIDFLKKQIPEFLSDTEFDRIIDLNPNLINKENLSPGTKRILRRIQNEYQKEKKTQEQNSTKLKEILVKLLDHQKIALITQFLLVHKKAYMIDLKTLSFIPQIFYAYCLVYPNMFSLKFSSIKNNTQILNQISTKKIEQMIALIIYDGSSFATPKNYEPFMYYLFKSEKLINLFTSQNFYNQSICIPLIEYAMKYYKDGIITKKKLQTIGQYICKKGKSEQMTWEMYYRQYNIKII